ncbi:sigma factor-like helix-turn-helix DNA-binding protein [Neobacillus niacini]|uniref:sigma factor-like helix-turn-helix DNA-binding protein n=1 Tax=Neobacillus niacini TaxID=86668 RepID=UPI002FFFCA56
MSNGFSQNTREDQQQENKTGDSFWIEYYPKLQRYCHFLAQNKWDGEDIAQEVYLKARKYSTAKHKMTSALVNKIAYNHWIDVVRKRKNESTHINHDFSSHLAASQLDDRLNSVELLLKHFTPKQAVIFMLKEAFQYQSKEIAAVLGTTEMAIKSNLNRAKKRLEKINETDRCFPMELFWDEEEREKLADLFNESLKVQDPSVLIDSLSSFKSVIDVPQLVSRNIGSFKTHTPSSTLCMAA